MTLSIDFECNGTRVRLDAAPNVTLLDVLHHELGLKGARLSCDQGVCGACTVLVDGAPAAACSTLAFQVAGARVTTIEGIAGPDGGLHPVQQAFIDAFALQCGYCTSGMIMAVCALLAAEPAPTRQDAARWLSGNVCRCTGDASILDAVELAAEALQSEST